MPTKEARLRAQKKYDESHKENYKSYHLKCSRSEDADIIEFLEAQPRKNTVIKEAIRRYLKGGK